MNAEILAVGTELLLGDILNTNAQYLAKQLASLGIGVYYQSVVGDNPQRLQNAFETAFSRADMVITTGGLGPTKDDLTKETAARYFGKEMVVHKESMEKLESFFQNSNRPMTENNRKQAIMPEGAMIIENNNGTAPGCIIEQDHKMLIMLPGPPVEVLPMFHDTVYPFLRGRSEERFVSRTLKIVGVGESLAEEMVKDIIENQQNPTIAPYAKTSEMSFRITASAKTDEQAHALIEPVMGELYKRFGIHAYGEDDVTLEETVINLLRKKGLKLAVAESCTGGLLASRIVDCAGASDVFLEGAVTYSNEAKINRLGVNEKTLETYGAVSSQTAEEMALGLMKGSNAQVTVSTTGIAGPDGGTQEKPVGLVYISICINGKINTIKLSLKGDRAKIRSRAVVNALDYLRRALLNEE